MLKVVLGNPHAVAAAAILLVLVGIFAARALPLQLRPTVEPPEIQVSTSYFGASPLEVEDQITRRIEDQLTSVSGLQELISSSGNGRSQITLRFLDGVDRNTAMVDVLNKLGGVQGLPPEADPPEATATTSDQQAPMMWFGIRGPEGAPPVPVPLLRQVVDDMIAPRFRRVDGVAGLIVSGGAEREAHIRVDFDRLAQLNLPVSSILGVFSKDNQDMRGGSLWLGKREYTVRTQARAATTEELAQLKLRESQEGEVRVGDVARVLVEDALQSSLMRQNGIPAVAIGLQRQTGANVPGTVEGVREAVQELRAAFAASGIPVAFYEFYSETTYIDEALDQAVSNILQGIVLSAIALYLVVRSLRAVGLVLGAQPLAVLVVFPVLFILGRSLNLITLAGLAFAVGITLDNAVVVVENIHRHRKMGKTASQAAEEGARELWGAMLAATLTNTCVFAPVLLLQGEAGQIFRDLAIAISVAAAGSLLVSMLALPAACIYWLGDVAEAEEKEGFLERLVGKIVDAVTGEKGWLRAGLVLLALVGSVGGLLFSPGVSYLPEGNRNLILTFARPLPGTSVEAASALLAPIESQLIADPRIERTFVVFNSRFQSLGATLKPEFADPDSFSAFLAELRGRTTSIPGFRFLFPRRASIFQDPGRQFEVTLRGHELGLLAKLSAEVMGSLKTLPGVVSVRSDYESGAPELQIRPDRRRLAELGLSPRDLGLAVEAAVGGRRVGTFLEEGRELDLVVVGEESYQENPAELRKMLVAPGVRLDSVATLVEGVGPVGIPHRDQERAVTLQVSLDETATLGETVEHVQSTVFPEVQARLQPGYTIGLGGTADKLSDTLSGLQSSFIWAVGLIYLLLVGLYRSWGLPIVILAAVPLAVCGALLGLAGVNLFTRVDFDTIAILGLILLAGVVVNVSILIVSQAQEFVSQGDSPRLALKKSSVTRLKPILMSAVTSVVGMLPLALGQGSGTELYRGLGVVMVSGILLSTLVTPMVVPAMMAFSKAWRK
jgi:HAE1 family hydrophobic/amphiphilic exporter-1